MKNIIPICRTVLLSVLLSPLLASIAQATDGKARLDTFFKGLKTMRAEFVQTLVDAEQRVKEESEGVLLLSRPGRFRLDYSKPYSQLYVADGTKVWMYDKDLEQVTVRPQAEALGSTPAMLLTGSEPLERSFTLEELGDHEGYTWIDLKPREKEATFAYIRLALEGEVIRAMEMVDNFGQMTRLFFHTVSRNPRVEAGAFRFTPPPGVDVVGE
ncbi:outer membrane lipoprotein chaperone LolA [Sulfurivermis fontis]|uniref:outer membrane lipoprotein chaperone LolA n=1 Tax=Sulfurivermis fontis TaxID=1972068 RepID=UPI000FDA5C75|nr:outer membrane lipoprotein chaperone LolA [Sulfurivermis fontis]